MLNNPTEEEIKLAISLGGYWIDGIGPSGESVRTLECCGGSKERFINVFKSNHKLPHYQITPILEVIEQLREERRLYQSQIVR